MMPFPIHLWDKTLPQAEITLNLLLRGSHINRLSARELLYGRYDFKAHPMAPQVLKSFLAHVRLGVRKPGHPMQSQPGTLALP
jgi:hypothetical protein